MDYNSVIIYKEIEIDISVSETKLFDLQHQITIEKAKKHTNLSKLGKLRYELDKEHEHYCNLYLMKHECLSEQAII
ncbi:hypothetical protein [Staphylococcus shinii]|uniref:hypothetical protein n=1 Tax=Staphylococcus shinii TaxID=2912228 RepID=UPI003F842521